jgi:hypothetical protein
MMMHEHMGIDPAQLAQMTPEQIQELQYQHQMMMQQQMQIDLSQLTPE